MREIFEGILPKILQSVKEFYGEKLVSVVVFGSVARGTPNPHSDIDLLIVCKELPQGVRKRINDFLKIEESLNPFLREAQRKGFNIEISPVIKTREEVKRGSLLFLDLVEEAKILYDKEDFFTKFLEEFKEKLNKLGAKRIKQGDRWYWVLKPDLQPGEVFEI